MEQFSFEQQPDIPSNIEELGEEEIRGLLVRYLKDHIDTNESVRDLLIEWSKRKESGVQDTEGQVRFEIERAKLYFESGCAEDGMQALEDAQMMASQEGFSDLEEEIEMIKKTN